jgi:hypothetical protein
MHCYQENLHDRDTEGGSVVVPGILPEMVNPGYTATETIDLKLLTQSLGRSDGSMVFVI